MRDCFDLIKIFVLRSNKILSAEILILDSCQKQKSTLEYIANVPLKQETYEFLFFQYLLVKELRKNIIISIGNLMSDKLLFKY